MVHAAIWHGIQLERSGISSPSSARKSVGVSMNIVNIRAMRGDWHGSCEFEGHETPASRGQPDRIGAAASGTLFICEQRCPVPNNWLRSRELEARAGIEPACKDLQSSA